MKNALLFLLLLIPLTVFPQLNDTIYYKSGEFIRCQITDINDTWILYKKYNGNSGIVEASDPINKVKKYIWNNIKYSFGEPAQINTSKGEINTGIAIVDTIGYLYYQISRLNADLGTMQEQKKVAGAFLDKAGNSIYTGVAFSIISMGFTALGAYSDISGKGNSSVFYGIGIGTGLISFVSYIIAPGQVKRAGKELNK